MRSALLDFIDARGCRWYIHSRQTPQGGFCFYRYPSWGVEEPNAPDTWAALASLALLDETPRHARLITKWLREQQDGNGGFPTLIIAEAVLEALRLLDALPAVEPKDYLSRQASRMASTYTDTMDPAVWLGSAHRYVRLLRNSGLPFHALEGQVLPVLDRLRQSGGGYAGSLISTWHALELRSLFEQAQDDKSLDFVHCCENSTFGFTLAPDSSAAGLETLYAGMHALNLCESRPRYPEATRRFVAGCQSVNGSFSRVPDALPDLKMTYYALAILSDSVKG